MPAASQETSYASELQRLKGLLQEELTRTEACESLEKFTAYTTPNWKPGKIHRAICGQLDRVVSGGVDRLMLLCPPQHGKSQIASRRFPAYLLGQNPRLEVISASATAQLAEEFGRDVRNCIGSQEYRQLFATELAQDSQARGRWNTEDGGGYYAVGIGGALMGRGAELGMIDDPFATWEDGQSQLSRDRAWDWYTGTFYNRIRPGGRIIVIQHRMHEDDLAGRLLGQQAGGGDRWEVVELPAHLDDPPWPERYDRKALERIKANTDPLKWSALYLQNPMPEEGTFFKREWFWFYKPSDVPNVRKYLTSDFAFTENGGDFTEIGIHGVYQDRGETKLYLCLDGWYGQADQVNWAEEYMTLVARHRPVVEFGEGGMTRRASEGLLTRVRRERKAPGGKIEWMPSVSDKVARAASLRAMASMGRVGLPDNDYGHRVLGQLLGFPAGKHDDAVDMVAMMARAIDQAHPAMALGAKPTVVRDRWDKVFDGDEGGSWRV